MIINIKINEGAVWRSCCRTKVFQSSVFYKSVCQKIGIPSHWNKVDVSVQMKGKKLQSHLKKSDLSQKLAS